MDMEKENPYSVPVTSAYSYNLAAMPVHLVNKQGMAEQLFSSFLCMHYWDFKALMRMDDEAISSFLTFLRTTLGVRYTSDKKYVYVNPVDNEIISYQYVKIVAVATCLILNQANKNKDFTLRRDNENVLMESVVKEGRNEKIKKYVIIKFDQRVIKSSLILSSMITGHQYAQHDTTFVILVENLSQIYDLDVPQKVFYAMENPEFNSSLVGEVSAFEFYENDGKE